MEAPSQQKPGKAGFISHLPASWIPYAELTRVDKPVACLYLYFPCIFGTTLAASISKPIVSPTRLLIVNNIFLLGSFMVRCAGCTWNDIVDQDLDRRVLRTRLRPMARRAISTSSAFAFTVLQVLAGLGVLELLLPRQCLYYSIPSILSTGLYPYGKRFTNYPQVILGCVFSWGVIMAFPALDLDLPSSLDGRIAVGCLYFSCMSWTMVYDTIYAAQDMNDDLKAGIGSPVVQHRDHTRRFIMAAALGQIVLLCFTGIAMKATWAYFGSTCLGTTLILGKMIRSVDLHDPKDCIWWFRNGSFITGATIGSGFIIEYVFRLMTRD